MNDRTLHTDRSPHAARLINLQLQFPRENHPLFDGCSLEIKQGEKILLLGPSGSGKSTLLKVLTGLIPDTIEVPVRWEERKPFHSWGYVFQDPDAQFCMPFVDEEIAFVLENIGAPANEMPARIEEYLQMVGLHFENIHRPIETLSQGQKQRLALASALALEPDTLVLDEPTALLDPEGTEAIWQQVRRLSKEKTLLVVEHKVEKMIDFMDRVIVLDDCGTIIADAIPTEIENKYQSLLDEYGIWHAKSWETYDQETDGLTLAVREADEEGRTRLLNIDGLKGFRDGGLCIELRKLQIHTGEWIAITGPNGAGKSTLLMALMQLIKTDGRCYLDGQLIEGTGQVASDIGFLFQNPELQFVAQSVHEEVAFTLERHHPDWQKEKINQRVQKTLEQFGLAELAGQHPYTLSTGQKRRLSVAATTVHQRKLLLLDEPTFGQDASNTFAILDELERYRRRGAALLMVTHDPAIVERFATRIWKIKDGRLEADQPGSRRPGLMTGEVEHYAI